MTRVAKIRFALAALLLLAGVARFVQAGFIPAMHLELGDFRASFPTAYFASLRPDFPTNMVWPGWTYGPVLHFLTLPLFLVPKWSMVGSVWALVNLAAVFASLVYTCRLSGVSRRSSWGTVICLAALWLWFKPLQSCFEQGDIELVEMAVTLAALVAVMQGRSRWPGILLGTATMMKFAPIGFLAWLGVRGRWRAVRAGLVTIFVIAVVAQFTLGWQNNGLALRSLWDRGIPQINADTQSVVSIFLHRAGLQDYTDFFLQRWFPTSRAATAAQAGELACVLLAAGYGLLLLQRRRHTLSPVEIAALFIPMLMLVTSNHQYYYVFALVPLSVLFLRAVADRQWGMLTLVMLGYFMMSAPFRFTWIDRANYFGVPFFYVLNYNNVMAYGALLVWATATYRMLSDSDVAQGGDGFWSRPRALLFAIPVVTIAIVVVWPHVVHARRDPAVPTAAVTLPSDMLWTSPSPMTLSPDGTRLAFITAEHGLCVSTLADGARTCWQAAPTDENSLVFDPASPFFSPDGTWIGFFSRGDLRRVPTAGGEVAAINGAPKGQMGSWRRDDTIVYASGLGIIRAKASGGLHEVIAPHRVEDGPYLTPVLTGDGSVLVFTIGPADGAQGSGSIVAQSLVSGRRRVIAAGSQPHLDEARGQLVFALGGQILAVPFSAAALDVLDLAIPVATDAMSTVSGGTLFDVSADGTLVYVPERTTSVVRRRLVWTDRTGHEEPLSLAPAAFEAPRLSPDGSKLAVTVRDILTDIWVYNLATPAATRVSTLSNQNASPVWMGDSQTVAFVSAGAPNRRPLVLTSRVDDGGRVPTTLWQIRDRDMQDPLRLSSASADGHWLAGVQAGDLWLLDASRPAASARLVQTPEVIEQDPVLSPDGRWIAFASNLGGKRQQIYVQPFPAMNELHQVSEAGGAEPRWSRDGREIFFRGRLGAGTTVGLMSAVVSISAGFSSAKPQPVFEEATRTIPGGTSYDVSPDGRRFIMIKEDPAVYGNDLRVVRRWFSRLPR